MEEKRKIKVLNILPIIFVIIALSSCATKMTNVPNGPPEYQRGFAAGCDSGYVAAGHPYYQFNKDHNAFNKDENYKNGWNDGFQTCKGKYDSINNMMR